MATLHVVCPACGGTDLTVYYWQEVSQGHDAETGEWAVITSEDMSDNETKPPHKVECAMCEVEIPLTKEVRRYFREAA